MPEYLVKEKSFIDNKIYEVGDTVNYDGLPADNLEPTCDAGRAKAAEYEESNKKRLAAVNSQFAESQIANGAEFAREFAKEMARLQFEDQKAVAAAAEEAAGKSKSKAAA